VLGLADQYSLGCVLYECLTGRVPFEKDLDAAIIWAHVEETPTMPTVLRPDLPPAIDEVFARVLAKNPGDRYESCKDFMTAAREALGPMADPPSPGGSLSMRLPRSGPAPSPAEPGVRRVHGLAVQPAARGVPGRAVRLPSLTRTRRPNSPTSRPTPTKPTPTRPPPPTGPPIAVPPHRSRPQASRSAGPARRQPARPTPPTPRPRVAGGRGGAHPGRGRHRGRGDDGPDRGHGSPSAGGATTPAAGGSECRDGASSSAPSVAVPTVAGKIQVGQTPSYVQVAPNGQFAYVANPSAGTITVINTATDLVSGTIKIPQGPPQFVSFSPDSRTAYVSVYNTRGSVHLIAFIDTATGTVTSAVPVDNFTPGPSTTSPDGRYLYVPNHNTAMSGANENVVDVIDTAARN
jgi:YVTN family beta-propeller protein